MQSKKRRKDRYECAKKQGDEKNENKGNHQNVRNEVFFLSIAFVLHVNPKIGKKKYPMSLISFIIIRRRFLFCLSVFSSICVRVFQFTFLWAAGKLLSSRVE